VVWAFKRFLKRLFAIDVWNEDWWYIAWTHSLFTCVTVSSVSSLSPLSFAICLILISVSLNALCTINTRHFVVAVIIQWSFDSQLFRVVVEKTPNIYCSTNSQVLAKCINCDRYQPRLVIGRSFLKLSAILQNVLDMIKSNFSFLCFCNSMYDLVKLF